MIKHYPIRMESATGKPTEYICLCGYRSADPKEFVPIVNPSMKGVTCLVALKKLNGATIIMKGNHDAERID